MPKLPIAKLVGVSMLIAFVGCGAGLFVCLWTGNLAAMTIVILAILAIGIALLMRWWLPLREAMEISKSDVPMQRRVAMGVAYVAFLASLTVLDEQIYVRTGNRLLEGVAGTIGGFAVGCFIIRMSWAILPLKTRYDASMMRTTALMQTIGVFVLTLNLISQMTERHPDGSPLQPWIVAGYLPLIPMMVMSAFGYWVRLSRDTPLPTNVAT